MIGFIYEECPWISSKRLFILCKARDSNFYWHDLFYYWESSLFIFIWDVLPKLFEDKLFFYLSMFLAIIARALPFLGFGRIICNAGDVPNNLFLINYLSFKKVPLFPVISDSKNMNLPLMLLWSNIFSTKYIILSIAISSTPNFLASYAWKIFKYCLAKK